MDKINSLIMDPADNVVTAVDDIPEGGDICYLLEGKLFCLQAGSCIPKWHKASLNDLEKFDEIIKYGESIGKLTENVKKGCLVSHLNLTSLPRDYESEYIKEEA